MKHEHELKLLCFSFWVTIWISLSLFIPESAGKPVCCLSQPDDVIWKKIGQDVVLACTVSCSQKDLRYVWFLSQQKSHLCLNLDSNHHKYSLNGASLHINSLNTNDSGIYHCAVVSNGPPALGAQYIGMGTTLEVNGRSLFSCKRNPWF